MSFLIYLRDSLFHLLESTFFRLMTLTSRTAFIQVSRTVIFIVIFMPYEPTASLQ